MGAWRTTVGEEKPRATRAATTQTGVGVVANEEMPTSLLPLLPTGGAVTNRPQKRLTCWSRAK